MNWGIFLICILFSISLQASDHRITDYDGLKEQVRKGASTGRHVHWHCPKDDNLADLEQQYPLKTYAYAIKCLKQYDFDGIYPFASYDISMLNKLTGETIYNPFATFYVTDATNCIVCRKSFSNTLKRTREAS
jgi:hypothetical protein